MVSAHHTIAGPAGTKVRCRKESGHDGFHEALVGISTVVSLRPERGKSPTAPKSEDIIWSWTRGGWGAMRR